ncbi:Transposase IS200 like protein [Planctomycetes bacterium MalM25]|nr:Transposase IS200 like protein [Planctomycetes bacterium MalM25]
MAQSLANVIVHLVFSTKHRVPLIDASVEADLHAYLAGVAKHLDCQPHKIGGVEDHVHVACSLARTIAVADLVQELKQSSSKWIKIRSDACGSFAWQNGYGAFSVSQSHLEALRRYVATQREHHRQQTYQEEFRTLLERYRIDYDERYVWD